jgi:hypothetical protein
VVPFRSNSIDSSCPSSSVFAVSVRVSFQNSDV